MPSRNSLILGSSSVAQSYAHHKRIVADFRPIASCNTVYKAISKIFTGRLSSINSTLIDPAQSAFVGGRNITYDLMLFSRRDTPSIKIITEVLSDFHRKFGLDVNSGKSGLFMSGIYNDDLHEIGSLVGFSYAKLPVKYFGITIAS